VALVKDKGEGYDSAGDISTRISDLSLSRDFTDYKNVLGICVELSAYVYM